MILFAAPSLILCYMTLFTSVQLRVLKSSWLPVLITWMITAGYAAGILKGTIAFPAFTTEHILHVLPLFAVVVWEMLARKEWQNALIMAVTVVLVAVLQSVLHELLMKRTDSDVVYVIGQANVFIGLLLIFITRFILSGMSDKLVAAGIGAVIYFLLPEYGIPFNHLQLARDLPVFALFTPAMKLVLTLPAIYCSFTSYYLIVYLLENSYRWPNYRLLLQSKVQQLTSWEYFFLFIALCFAYSGAIGVLDTNVYRFFEERPASLLEVGYMMFATLGMILLLYTVAGLMRNIVTSRALSVGKYSYWMLLLHFIPVVNIAGVVTLFFAKDQPATIAEHADTYLNQDRRVAQLTMIITGIMITVFNIYTLLTAPTGFRLPVIGFIAALYLLKIYAYTRLRTGMSAVILVMVLNVSTILFANSGHLILLLALLYLYYFLLVELFSPKLEMEDTIEFREPETGDIFTHTA